MDKKILIEKIKKLKEEKNAVIVAHNYQIDDIQQVADVLGDSYAISKYCANSNAKVIVFCGVHFMAESAKILSPEKTVLLPELDAGCPMADMVTAEQLRKRKEELGNPLVVCYINSSAEVKAESDVCCTSSNAEKVVSELLKEENREILFVPDSNLGGYIAGKLPDSKFSFWEGHCPIHNEITVKDVEEAKKEHPNAKLAIHPECKKEVVAFADYIGSTKGIIDYCTESEDKEYIIGTEIGVLYELKRRNPDKIFHKLKESFICENMKKTSLESVYRALNENIYEIEVEESIRTKAKKCLDRMLELTEK